MTRKIAHIIKTKWHIVLDDFKKKGVRTSIRDRVNKRMTTRKLYALFLPNSVMVHEYRLYIDKHDAVISHYLLQHSVWDPSGTNLFKKNIKKGDTVLDIGAHIGYFTLLASKLVGPTGMVYAFEPDPINFALLQKNIKTNNVTNVKIFKTAVTDKNGTVTLYSNTSANTGDNSLFKDERKNKKYTVRQGTIDSIIPSSANFIKIDIQGGEYKAVKGMKKLIKRSPHLFLYTELWPQGLLSNGDTVLQYLSLLKALDFKLKFMISHTQKKISREELLGLIKSNKIYDVDLFFVK